VTSPDGTRKKKKRIPQKKKQKKKRTIFAEPTDGATRNGRSNASCHGGAREKEERRDAKEGHVTSMHDPWPVGLPSSSRAWLHASEHGRPYMCRKWAAISFQTEMMMVSQLLSITSRVAKCLLSSVSSVEALHCPKAYMISSCMHV
jgi:hypothetical protein